MVRRIRLTALFCLMLLCVLANRAHSALPESVQHAFLPFMTLSSHEYFISVYQDPVYEYAFGGSHVAVLQSGDIVVMGHDGFNDPWLMRADAFGAPIWEKKTGYDVARDMAVTDDEGFLFLTRDTGGAFPQARVLRYGPDATLLWSRHVASTIGLAAEAVTATTDGGSLLVLGASRNPPMRSGTLVVKLGAEGNTDWHQLFAHALDGFTGKAVYQTDDGGYAIAGDSSEGGLWFLRLDEGGAIAWQSALRSPWEAYYDVTDLVVTAAGNIVAVGEVLACNPICDRDAWGVMLDSSGNLLWDYAYDQGGQEAFSKIEERGDGSLLIAGNGGIWQTPEPTAFILALRPDGSVEWLREYGGALADEFAALALDEDGNIYVTGSTSSFGKPGAWLLKLSPDGLLPHCSVASTGTIERHELELTDLGYQPDSLPYAITVAPISIYEQTLAAERTVVCPDFAGATGHAVENCLATAPGE